MREIKFRGRGAPRGKQWFYGDLDTHTSGVCILDYDALHAVVPETVGQFTGLVDADGREIYEGDIVKVVDDGEESFHVVKYMIDVDYPAFDLVPGLNVDYNGLAYCEHYYDDNVRRYVIGNIYDNPELLKLTKK